MTREEAINEINKVFTPAYANYIVTALTEGATVSDKEPTTKNDSGVDWESYKDVDGNSLDDLILEVLQNNFDCGNTYGYKVTDEIIGLLPSVTPQEPNTWSLDDAREDFMDDVYSELGFLPTNEEANRIIDSFDRVTSSIEQEHKWIPVTERLPEEGYSVLVMRITDDSYKYMRVATYQGDCWMDNTDKFNKPNPHKVIAWMPLPEPYKVESEDEDGSNSKYGNA